MIFIISVALAMLIMKYTPTQEDYDAGYRAATARCYEWISGWDKDCDSQGKQLIIDSIDGVVQDPTCEEVRILSNER